MSTVKYNGAHDIAFWDPSADQKIPKFLWDDFCLIPKRRPFVTLPEVQNTVVNIPKTNKYLNITNYMPGKRTYGGRKGQWDFYIDNTRQSSWASSLRQLESFINGKRLYVSLNDVPGDIFVGRFKVTGYAPGSDYSSVSIGYDLDYIMPDNDIKRNLKYRIQFVNEYGYILQSTYETFGAMPDFVEASIDASLYNIKGYDKTIETATYNERYIVYLEKIKKGSYTHPIRLVSIDDNAIYRENYLPNNIILQVN